MSDYILIAVFFLAIVFFWIFSMILKDRIMMNGFKRIKPSVAKHKDGYLVQGKERGKIQYVNGEIIAEVDIEPFSKYSDDLIYPESLVAYKNGEKSVLAHEEKEVILQRIRVGMKCLWS